ncbi:MAG: hypothetical protein ACYC64_03370 [Armatimonadota bacterium]
MKQIDNMQQDLHVLLRCLVVGLCAVALGIGSFGTVHAMRLIATPFAETLPEAKTQVWQFFLRENRSTDEWRTLNRLDIGLTDRLEFGVLLVNPSQGPVDTWLNLQYRLNKETNKTPVFSVGIWDVGRIQDVSGQKTGGSFFVAAGKTFRPAGEQSPQYIKLSLGAGTNRLNGLFGGTDVRLTKNLGLFVEYAPTNLQLPNTGSVDAALYYWVSPQWRVRTSWMGGNPMFDAFYTWTIGKK